MDWPDVPPHHEEGTSALDALEPRLRRSSRTLRPSTPGPERANHPATAMFTVGEAISLLLGLTALRRLRAKPFAAELETAEHKLLAAVPDHLRTTLAKTQHIVGFEAAPTDVFTLERGHPETVTETDKGAESRTVTVFLQAILEHRAVTLRYRSPYRAAIRDHEMKPLGLVWDRDRWYLAGQRLGKAEAPRLWRADRVLTIRNGAASAWGEAEFDVTHLLGRQWLREAMAQWSRESPVTIRLNTPQAERLRQDWYYGHARFERLSNDEWRMTYGEDNREYVFELLRWLGPEAELLEPQAWRAELREGLERMIAKYR